MVLRLVWKPIMKSILNHDIRGSQSLGLAGGKQLKT